METKKDMYYEIVDNLLVLINNAKRMGFDLNIEEIAKVVGVDLNNIDHMTEIDLTTQLSINKLYAKSNVLFKTVLEAR